MLFKPESIKVWREWISRIDGQKRPIRIREIRDGFPNQALRNGYRFRNSVRVMAEDVGVQLPEL